MLSRRSKLGAAAAGFSPADISGLVAWYAADALALNDADPVASWSDLSGEGHDLAQATSGSRPSYRTNGLNSLPVVRHDGTDDFLTGGSAFVAHHWLVVAKHDGPNFANYLGLITGTGAGDGEIILVGAAGSNTFYDDPGQTTVNRLAGVASLDAPMSAFGIVSVSSVAGWNVTPQIGKDRNTARFWIGDIAEAIAYDAVLSTTDLNSVAGYLADKYGLAWADVA